MWVRSASGSVGVPGVPASKKRITTIHGPRCCSSRANVVGLHVSIGSSLCLDMCAPVVHTQIVGGHLPPLCGAEVVPATEINRAHCLLET